MVPRSRRLARALTLLATGCLALTGCWFQPGWGPHRSGHNPAEIVLTSGNVATLVESWTATTDEPEAVLDPVVTSEGVHAVSGPLLSSYRLADGAERWSTGILPFPCEPETCEGRMTYGTPSMRGDQILVPTIYYYPQDATYAFDAASGAHAGPAGVGGWSASVDGDAVAMTTAIRSDQLILLFSYVDHSDPSRSWTRALNYLWPRWEDVATLGDEHVFFNSSVRLVAYAREQPEDCDIGCPPLWSVDLSGGATPAVLSDDGETVYVGDGSGRVWALRADDGTVRWSSLLGREGDPRVVAAPTVGDGWLYVAAADGRVYVLDSDGCGLEVCTPVWAASTGSPVTKQPALAGGVLYVGSADGSINAYDANGCGSIICAPLWRATTGSRITGGPVVAFGRLLVGTLDGRLIAYRPS